ncbi:MAG: phosphoribosylamine--glycine ligase [Hyphomicrobiaceae bacterium]
MTKILILCKSGRLHAIGRALKASRQSVDLYALAEVHNPGLDAIAQVKIGKTDAVAEVVAYAREIKPDFVVIGPEEPLFAGVVDALERIGIPCVGPKKAVARIEWSKAFARTLLSQYLPEVNPRFRVFSAVAGISDFLKDLGDFVIKPDGLTGGKGVKVSGVHLAGVSDAITYCREVFASGHEQIVIEEKLDGEEFTFQSFCDGTHVVHTIPVQDHKRLLDGDKGPNTGGMGSYSCEDHGLPFLAPSDLAAARKANEIVAAALRSETGIPYKGILYGGFIATRDGVKVIEYNSRFGDPEVMNVLPLLETDFVSLCEAIVEGTLSESHVKFAKKATVCKYIVPKDYPTAKKSPGVISAAEVAPDGPNLRVYYAALRRGEGSMLELTSSRALAFVGIGEDLAEAAEIAEAAAAKITGPVHHRKDIGSTALIKARVDHMRDLRSRERRTHEFV